MTPKYQRRLPSIAEGMTASQRYHWGNVRIVEITDTGALVERGGERWRVLRDHLCQPFKEA